MLSRFHREAFVIAFAQSDIPEGLFKNGGVEVFLSPHCTNHSTCLKLIHCIDSSVTSELSSSWQSQHRDTAHSQLVILTSECQASSDCPDSAPGADHRISPLSHDSEPANPNYHFTCAASTCECIWLEMSGTMCTIFILSLHCGILRCFICLICVCFFRCCCSPSSSKRNLCCWLHWSPTPAWLLLWLPPHPWPPL